MSIFDSMGNIRFEGNVFATPQDAFDGLALRRLREALPGLVEVRHDPTYGNLNWVVTAWPVRDGWKYPLSRMGATIADAADKCREALG